MPTPNPHRSSKYYYALSDPFVRRTARYPSTDSLARAALRILPPLALPAEPPSISVRIVGNEIVLASDTQLPATISESVSRIARLLRLEPDWNSYQAPRIDRESAKRAIEFLLENLQEPTPMPQIVPTQTGGIQIEWHIGGIDLEIEVESTGETVFDFETVGVEEREGRLPRDNRLLSELISRLSS